MTHMVPPRIDRPPSGDTSLIHAVERLLSASMGITTRAIGDAPDAASLTLVQWRVLVIAARTDGLRIGELAAHLGTSVPSASRLVRRIERRQLVVATRSEEDRRATIVTPTEAGRRLVDDVVARRRELIGMALRDRPQRDDPAATALIEAISASLAEFT